MSKPNKSAYVIQDTIPGAIHPGTGLYTESRKQWETWNRQTGWETSGTVQRVKRDEKAERLERKADRIQALQRAKQALEWGMHPRSAAYKESLRREKAKMDIVTPEMKEKIRAAYISEVTKDLEEEFKNRKIKDD